MKKSNWILSFVLLMFLNSAQSYACHKGGALGIASGDPLASTIDYSTMSSFMPTSTTFGTAGCEKWDFVKFDRLDFLHYSWNNLSEEILNQEGGHFESLSQVYGCEEDFVQAFDSMIYGNYEHLFIDSVEINHYDKAHLLDYEINRLIIEYNLQDKCKLKAS